MDNKLKFLIAGGVVAVLIMVIVVVVVNRKPTNTNKPKQTSGNFIIWDYNNEKAAYDSIMTDFQKTNNIKVEYVAKDKTTYLQDTIDAIAAGNGPDLMVAPNDIMPEFKDKLIAMPDGFLADSGAKKTDLEVYADRYSDAIYQNNVLDNKIYAVPMTIDGLKIFVNNGWFDQKINDYRLKNPYDRNVDKMRETLQNGFRTWEDFLTLVKFFTKKNAGQLTVPVAALGTSSNVSQAPDILTLIMMQNGAQMVSSDLGTALFNTKQNNFGTIDYPGTKGLEFYASFANPQSENYTWNKDQGEAIRAFAEQKVPIIFEYGRAKAEIALISPDFRYAEYDLPQIKETRNPITYARFDNLVVPKSAKNTTLSWKFVFEATDRINSIDYFVITKKQKPLEIDRNSSLAKAKVWYKPNVTKTDEIFRSIIQQVNDGKNAQTAMDGAAGQITNLLGRLKK